MSEESNPIDWPLLGVGLGYVAAVAIFCTWATMSGRWELAATSVGSIVLTAAALVYFSTRVE